VGFGSFISHLVAPVTKALGPVGTLALLPAITISEYAGNIVDKGVGLAGHLATGVASPTHPQSTPVLKDPGYTAYNPNPSYPQPYAQSYQQPYYGGGDTTFQGGSPWASSTQYPTYSTPQYQTSPGYSAQDRTWEDLTSIAGLIF
jgi:hypothetical protein